MKENIKTLLKNTLIAQSLGDAFGYIVEFKSWNIIKRDYGSNGLEYTPETLDLIVSDDTQMNLFCLKGLIDASKENNAYLEDPTDCIYSNYLDWFKTQCFFETKPTFSNSLMSYDELFFKRAPGMTCLSALQKSHKGTLKNRINDSKGCGGIMRTIPVSFYATSCNEAFEWGTKQAAITHGHTEGFLSAGAYSALAYELIHNTDNILKALSSVEKILLKQDENSAMVYTLNKLTWNIKQNPGLKNDSLTEELGQGWVGEEAFAVAVYCAAVSTSFKQVLELSSNHSGDSDSTAMLAAGIWYLANRDDSFVNDIKFTDIEKPLFGLLDLI